ncbi:glycosyltransferase [Chromatiaceae bacterium AAb-1]|nr:glycosyltransferase [Chromatiaceae bacterium AAb-1]
MTNQAVSSQDIILDCSHMGRRTTGIERITRELFSDESLANTSIVRVEAGSVAGMIFQQWFGILFTALKEKNAVIITPGFPPSMLLSVLFGKRLIPYIHDVFLLTRPDELNVRAKYYMRPSFYVAVKHLRLFFVNSLKTSKDLQQFCRPDARIVLFRPEVSNVFGLDADLQRYRQTDLNKLKIVMLGTLEPRKNYSGAIRLFQALQARLGQEIELHIIGRLGWGPEAEKLSNIPGIICHGYLEKHDIKALVQLATFYLSTSHDEGLGLPLLELQYSGIAVVASDIDVFSEVLADSGVLIDVAAPESAADKIIRYFSDRQWLQAQPQKALDNIQRWNTLATQDKKHVLACLKGQ